MGVCPDHRPELPDDLVRLGEQLEAAASVQLGNRRRRRRSLLKGACAVVLGIPLALAAATTDVAPSARPVAEIVRPEAPPTLVSASFRLDRVPDEAAAGGRPCVMVPDCRAGVRVYP